MNETKPRWPKYEEPASKGDIISAMVLIRSCIVDIYVALSAMKREDRVRFAEVLRDLNLDDERLAEAIDDLGGATKDD